MARRTTARKGPAQSTSTNAYAQFMKFLGPQGRRVDPYGRVGGGRCMACCYSSSNMKAWPHNLDAGCEQTKRPAEVAA